MSLSVISCFFGLVSSLLFLPDIIFIVMPCYAIEQRLSCRVRWHPRPTSALDMSQQGNGDMLTLGSASVFPLAFPWFSPGFPLVSAAPQPLLARGGARARAGQHHAATLGVARGNVEVLGVWGSWRSKNGGFHQQNMKNPGFHQGKWWFNGLTNRK